jgi:hypothetical protein
MKRLLLVALLSSAVVLGLGGGALGAVGESLAGATPPTPESVRAAFDGNARGPTVVEYRRVSPLEVGRKPANVPANAATEGPEIAANPNTVCWYLELSNARGYFPYHRRHHLATHWCANYYGGDINFRQSWTWGTVSGTCDVTETDNWKIGGGVGYNWVKVHSHASFSCPTPWWWRLNDTLWMNVAYNVWGNWAVEESDP